MKQETKEMANRLRNNQQRNLRDYEKQSQQKKERIAEVKSLEEENFLARQELKEIIIR